MGIGLLEIFFYDVEVLLGEVGVDEDLFHLFVPLAVELAAVRGGLGLLLL